MRVLGDTTTENWPLAGSLDGKVGHGANYTAAAYPSDVIFRLWSTRLADSYVT